MAVDLIDFDKGIKTPLWNAQELRNETSAEVDEFNAIGFDADDTFLTALEFDGRISLNGEVSAHRLTRDSRFSDEPRKALAQWAFQLESYVDGGQGNGYTLQRNYVGDVFDGVVESIQWTANGGEPYTLGWNISFIRGQGTGVPGNASEPNLCPSSGFDSSTDVCPGTTWSIDGVDIPYPTEFQLEVSQTYEVYRRAFADNEGENDLMAETGPVRRITIMADVTGDESTRESTYDNISSSIGQNETINVREGTTGRLFEGVIANFDRTDEAGLTRLGEFGLELVQGGVS